jgi:YVTN family beta-propeller protein
MKRSFLLLVGFAIGLPSVGLTDQLLVLNKSDATLVFADPASGKVSAPVPTGDGPHEIELSADGRTAFVSNYGASVPGNTLSVIDVVSRKELKRVDLGDLRRPHGLSFSKGSLYFTVEGAQRIGRLDPATLRVDWTFETGQHGTHMVLASRDGRQLFATNMGSGNVSVLEQDSKGEWRQTLVSVGAGPEGLDQSPDGKELWVAHSRDGGISIIDVATKEMFQTLDAQTQRSNRLKFTRDGARVLVSDLGAGELVVFDARSRQKLRSVKLGRAPTGILIAPDGRHAFVAVSGDNRIAVVDLESLSVARTIEPGNSPDGMAWARPGQ